MNARSSAPAAVESHEVRYHIERKLGEGGAGTVYLVRDRENGEQLALKQLLHMDAKSVLRLKREFRSLQSVHHPNLIKLYDMGQSPDSWYLTMEYLDGVDLTAYLSAEEHAAVTGLGSAFRLADTLPPAARSLPHAARLLSTFRQLALGIHALHSLGLLHRDLKPSNVIMVEHRAVLLDFGLVRELGAPAARVTEDGMFSGTPAYMAPEQISGMDLTAATDWYAFGVMLYEALCGVLPLEGSMMALLRAKLETDPLPLAQVAPGVPLWLSDLCVALLRRDPGERPSGVEVLARFDASAQHVAVTATGTESLLHTEQEGQPTPNNLVGREAETKQLWKALAQAERGRAVIVHVRGLSGTGKSALVEHFLDHVEREGAASSDLDAVVLRSRCYELEAMPFKALDGVMDALARHLARLEDLDVAHLLPADIAALAQVFPVLERLNAVKRLVSRSKLTHDALQIRRRAEAALRVLLENLATRTPIVVWIDDLQWGDLDSARILKSWLAQVFTAPILFVFSYRSDECTTSTCLGALLKEDAERPCQTLEHTIDIAPLGGADIQALCEQRFGAHTQARAGLIERVVQEAQGSPFLASQLIALADAKSARGDADLHMLSLDLMVAQTSALLTEDAKNVLAVLAVAGRPMSPKIALQAAGVKRGGRALVHDLRGLSLVRTRELAGVRMLEVYHDRVRERVQAALSREESRLWQGELFSALQYSGQAEPDWLHALALGAGQDAQALHYGNAAAERATASMAFERAVALHRKCLELVPAADSGELWRKLSVALARCGRGREAAEASLEAAKHAPESERATWVEIAAAHFLRSGHIAQGELCVRELLDAKRIVVPTSDAGFKAAIAWESACISLHGTRDRLRSKDSAPAELLERIDLLMALQLNIQNYDPLRATLFRVRALRAALEAGEPTRLVRALAAASNAAAVYGSAQAARDSAALLARAEAVNAQLPTSDEKSLLMARAVSAFMLGRMHEVQVPAREAERLYRANFQDDPSRNHFWRYAVVSVRLGALHVFGEYRELITELKTLLDEGEATDNRSVALQTTVLQTVAEQLAGQAAKSRPRLEAHRAELPSATCGIFHVLHLVAVMRTACWTGEYAWANEYLDIAWPGFLRSLVRRSASLAFMAFEAHARFVLNQHVAARGQEDLAGTARVANQDIQALENLPLAMGLAAAQQLRARIAHLDGRTHEAISLLCQSIAGYRHEGMKHHAACAEYGLGVLLADDKGAALCLAAEQRIQALGVVDVRADLCAQCPELMGADPI